MSGKAFKRRLVCSVLVTIATIVMKCKDDRTSILIFMYNKLSQTCTKAFQLAIIIELSLYYVHRFTLLLEIKNQLWVSVLNVPTQWFDYNVCIYLPTFLCMHVQ